jgi:competence protein ComEA
MKYLLSLILAVLACINLAFAAVNINTATQDELDSVKGIGPGKAKAIIDYRTKNGPFKSVEDLKGVKGFGEKSLAKLKGDLTVSGASTAPAPVAVKPKKKPE